MYAFFAAVMMTLSMSAASYGILVNGKTYYAGTKADDFEGFTQYLAHVPVKSGDYCQLYDKENEAAWAVDLNTASVDGFTRDGDKYNVTTDGCFDFYIKIKYKQDQLYIGPGSNCGEGEEISGGGGGQGGGTTPGGGQGGGTAVEGNPRYYYKGYIDNEDVEPSEATLFDHGVAEISFTEHAMLFVLYQVDGQEGVQYMTPEWIDGERHTTLSVGGNGGYNKWNCPLGTTTLYLYDNGDGTLEISADILPGKKLADPQPEGVENVTATEKAHKVIIDGQLRIVRGDKVFDATGRQL